MGFRIKMHLIGVMCLLFFPLAALGLDFFSKPTNLGEQNYHALKKMRNIYQEAVSHPWPQIPDGKLLKIGSKNKSVLLLRERLRATNDLPAYYDHGDILFDQELADAVMLFQTRHGLNPDGIVGAATFKALNVSPSDRLNQIEVNMQRWLELAPHLKNEFVMVNVPDFKLFLYENNKPILSMKAIVGKPSRPTPELSSIINIVVFNPAWNVPRRIANKDIIPKVIENPSYLDDMHIRIFESQTNNAVELSQEQIDWIDARENGFNYFFRQDPGIDNALGLVKFEFRNTHDVYLHDTPTKNLFDADKRAFSSGCIRLEDPFALVTYLMANNPKWDDARQQEILDEGETKYIRASHPMPIFITYLTAWIDDEGLVNFRDDLYNKDRPETEEALTEEKTMTAKNE